MAKDNVCVYCDAIISAFVQQYADIKTVQDPFDILPVGWLQVTHASGMPIFLHKPTRVCSLSRPYFLGPGSARVGWAMQPICNS